MRRVVAAQSRLATLTLSGNGLGDDFALALSSAMLDNTRLEGLDLSNNRLGVKGGLELAVLFESNGDLAEVSLAWNDLRGRGGAAVLGAIATQHGMDLCTCDAPRHAAARRHRAPQCSHFTMHRPQRR